MHAKTLLEIIFCNNFKRTCQELTKQHEILIGYPEV